MDGVVVLNASVPGGSADELQPGRHGHPRGRALGRPLAHVPGRQQRQRRPRRGYLGRGGPRYRLPDRPQHLHDLRPRSDQELHGLHLRLVHEHVHRWAGFAPAGPVDGLPRGVTTPHGRWQADPAVRHTTRGRGPVRTTGPRHVAPPRAATVAADEFRAAFQLPPAFPERAAWGTASKLRAWQQEALDAYLAAFTPGLPRRGHPRRRQDHLRPPGGDRAAERRHRPADHRRRPDGAPQDPVGRRGRPGRHQPRPEVQQQRRTAQRRPPRGRRHVRPGRLAPVAAP